MSLVVDNVVYNLSGGITSHFFHEAHEGHEEVLANGNRGSTVIQNIALKNLKPKPDNILGILCEEFARYRVNSLASWRENSLGLFHIVF